jgi:hypothetical protein
MEDKPVGCGTATISAFYMSRVPRSTRAHITRTQNTHVADTNAVRSNTNVDQTEKCPQPIAISSHAFFSLTKSSGSERAAIWSMELPHKDRKQPVHEMT